MNSRFGKDTSELQDKPVTLHGIRYYGVLHVCTSVTSGLNVLLCFALQFANFKRKKLNSNMKK